MKIGCFTCKYGYEDERLGIPMCHHPKRFSEDCVNFNMYEEKETEESEKPMEQEGEVKPCHKTRNRLAERSKTSEGMAAYEKVAEEMRKQIVPNDLEKAAEISFDEAYALTGDYVDFLAKGLKEKQPRPIGPHWFCEYAKKRFVAGAKWQAEKDARDMYMSDNRHFEKVYQLGKNDMKEQMLNDAVEGEVYKLGGVAYVKECNNSELTKYLSQFNNGDRVKIIVIHETDIR